MRQVGFHVALFTRLLLAVPGAYIASAGLVAAFAVALPTTGLARSEAVALSSMLGFVVYLALFVWVFAQPRLWLLSAVLTLVALLGFGVARLAGPIG